MRKRTAIRNHRSHSLSCRWLAVFFGATMLAAATPICTANVGSVRPADAAATSAVATTSARAATGWTHSRMVDDEHARIAREILDKAIAYLRTQQDASTGAWAFNPDGPTMTGITALIIDGMLMDPYIHEDDKQVSHALDYLLSKRKPDGSIDDGLLQNYNTSLALSAFSRCHREDVVAAIKPAQDFLRGLQWDGQKDLSGRVVDKSHPWYGGAGYTVDSRPDNSNLQFMIQAMHDSGLDCNDPAYQRALVFLQRTQMLDSVNDQPYADGSKQGGFIYSAGKADPIGQGESKAGTIEETLDDGTVASRLQCYGSMTYAGFKSYVYANLSHDDPRVVAAYNWIRRNYTLNENPGMGKQGLYYYYMTFSRALKAYGDKNIITLNPDGTDGDTHVWANDLIDKLATLQRSDGSFVNAKDRWMESNPVLVTGYVVLALQTAINN